MVQCEGGNAKGGVLRSASGIKGGNALVPHKVGCTLF